GDVVGEMGFIVPMAPQRVRVIKHPFQWHSVFAYILLFKIRGRDWSHGAITALVEGSVHRGSRMIDTCLIRASCANDRLIAQPRPTISSAATCGNGPTLEFVKRAFFKLLRRPV